MQQIDTNKIKTMTSDRIAYTLYERNRIMKKKKLKKALFSVVVCILLLGGITTVDALSQGKISDTLKNTVKVILIGDDNQNVKWKVNNTLMKMEIFGLNIKMIQVKMK